MNHSSQSPTPSKGFTSETEKRHPRILAVDTQRDSFRLLQSRLEQAGFECLICTDGAAVLEFLARELVDLVILDAVMPHMDGFDLCRRIKSNERTRDIPVLFLTTKLDTEDKVAGLEAGAHDYLSEPIERTELLARTRAALRVKLLQDELKQQIQLRDKLSRLHQDMLSEHWQKTLGQLAASLAHEINNPLAVALGNVQLLAMLQRDAGETKARLQIIDQSLQRVGEKLRSLLLIAHASRESQEIKLNEIVQDLLAIVNFQVVMHKIAVEAGLDPDSSWRGVPGELATALLYLLNNAIEAVASRPDPRLTIEVVHTPDHELIRITDNGQGIPDEIQPRIFEPFFTTKSPPHHGVGLYLANEFIRSVGGQINFQSIPAKRLTQFSITLPPSSRTS